jgi:hypothetical protein
MSPVLQGRVWTIGGVRGTKQRKERSARLSPGDERDVGPEMGVEAVRPQCFNRGELPIHRPYGQGEGGGRSGPAPQGCY